MNHYYIVSDSCLGFSPREIKAKEVSLMPIDTVVNDTEYELSREQIPLEDFFQEIREGERPTTMIVNPSDYQGLFEELLKEGKGFLYIVFSSDLSSSYTNTRLAINDLQKAYPDRKIGFVGSRSTATIQSLVLDMALNQQVKGKTMDQVIAYLEENIPCTRVESIVDDLFHSEREERISKIKAAFGAALRVVPILPMDQEGKLHLSNSVRGRKKAIRTLPSNLKENIDSSIYDEIYISHSSSREEVLSLKEVIEELGTSKIHIHEMSLTIVVHTEPGCLISAYGSEKKED